MTEQSTFDYMGVSQRAPNHPNMEALSCTNQITKKECKCVINSLPHGLYFEINDTVYEELDTLN